MKLHRNLGKTYLIAILIGGLCSFVMAATASIQLNLAWAVSLGALGVAWLITSSMAYRAVRLKRISQHKEWMIRSYIVTFGFVTFRILTDVGMMLELGSFPEIAPTNGWLAWVIPLLIGEVVIQWNKE